MFSDARTPNYNLRQQNILDTKYSNTPSGDKCIRFYLPKSINKTDTNILEKISTHSYYGFVFHIKRKTLDSYSSECNIQNCYICSTSSSPFLHVTTVICLSMHMQNHVALYDKTMFFIPLSTKSKGVCWVFFFFNFVFLCKYILFSSCIHN